MADTIIITGASSGIGKEMARELAKKGAKLILTGRNREKGEDVVSEIRSEMPEASVDMLYGDFSEKKEIETLAESIKQKTNSVNILFNNAGGFFPSRTLNSDGLEMTFAVNHLGYFYFTHLLMDLLSAESPARVLNTSSKAHFSAKPDLSDINFEKSSYNGWKSYSSSKLYNLLFTYEFVRRFSGSGITMNAFHPGVIATDIVRNVFFPVPQLWKLFSKSVKDGAKGGLYLAGPEGAKFNGKFFDGTKEKKSSPISCSREKARELWEISERLCGIQWS